MSDYIIFTPTTFEHLLSNVPKPRSRIQLELMLNTGARYNELRAFSDHPKWYHPKEREIVFPAKYTKTLMDRAVPLTPQFNKVFEHFMSIAELHMPSRQSMDKDLKRWYPGSEWHPSCRTFRKTWVTWLLFTMPEKADLIYASMGHSREISHRHYLLLTGVLKNEVDKVKDYTKGWMT